MFAKRASSLFKSYGVKHCSTMMDYFHKDNIFRLKIRSSGDDSHCLTPALVHSFRSQLNKVKSEATNGSVLITTAEGQKFCTGFPPIDKHHEVIDLFRELVKDLISFPMPTIAAINGEATNAGLILALSHDHLTMKPKKHLLRMTVLNSKMPLPDYFVPVVRSKVKPGASSRFLLSTVSYTYEDAKNMDLAVHPVKGLEDTEAAAKRVAKELLSGNWDGKAYAEKRRRYPDLCKVLGISCAPSSWLSKSSS